VPFKADNPLSIIMKVVNEAPVPPVQYNNRVPQWLNHVVLQCLAKDPNDRFADAGQLATALSKAQAPVFSASKKQANVKPKSPARPSHPAGDIKKPPPRRKKTGSPLKTFAWLLFILLLVLGGFYAVNYKQKMDVQYLIKYLTGNYSRENIKKGEALPYQQIEKKTQRSFLRQNGFCTRWHLSNGKQQWEQ
jgi:serine/threonine protein kinase